MYRILVVDDYSEFNGAVCACLVENGFETKGCLNTKTAYDAMYGGVHFDLIISDIIMPNVDGFEVKRRVNELMKRKEQ